MNFTSPKITSFLVLLCLLVDISSHVNLSAYIFVILNNKFRGVCSLGGSYPIISNLIVSHCFFVFSSSEQDRDEWIKVRGYFYLVFGATH